MVESKLLKMQKSKRMQRKNNKEVKIHFKDV